MPLRYVFQIRVFTGLLLLCANSTIFAAPALNLFIQQIWENNPSIKSAEAALAAANAQKRATDQPIYNPEMDVEVARTDINTLSIGVSQSLDWGNKQSASSQIANIEIQIAEAVLDLQRTELAQEVLDALLEMQTTQKMQKLAQRRVELMQEFVTNTEKRHQAGDISVQDLALARVAFSEAQMQQAKSLAQQIENEARLKAVSGLMDNHWPTLEIQPPNLPPSVNIEKYLDQLPSLRILKSQFLAAKSRIILAQAERKADPSFGIRAGMEDSNALLGLSFSIPLNVRNTYRAEVEVASQQALQVEQEYLSAAQRSKAHLIGAHRRYQVTYDAWQSWNKNGLNSLKNQMQLIQTIWQSGEMNTSDYLIQSKQNVDAQGTAVELSSEMWKSWLEWLVASGQIANWIKKTN